LKPIAGRLNELLGRLEQSFERERRFSADLAHELRTPIAELRNLAECALKWPESREPGTDTEVLAVARHMEALTTSMLALSRGGSGQAITAADPIRLDQLIEEVWVGFAERAEAKGLTVARELTAGIVIADATLMRSILSNLFDNAVEYTSAGHKIEIVLEIEAGAATLTVTNPAAGLNANDTAKLFDPFWRKEASRSGGQHVGLGLALARTFATAMGWTLTAERDERQYLVITLGGSMTDRETRR